MSRPFKCPHCQNWYVDVPTEGECWSCVNNLHAPNPRNGVVDCHWGQESAHPSETKMAETVGALEQILGSIKTGDLVDAERLFARAESLEREVPNVLTWAGVMEMPGMLGEPQDKRFKHISAMEELVANNRRPASDLAMLRRSIKNCTEMADEVPALMAQVRMAIGEARRRAMNGETKPPLYVSDKPKAPRPTPRKRPVHA